MGTVGGREALLNPKTCWVGCRFYTHGTHISRGIERELKSMKLGDGGTERSPESDGVRAQEAILCRALTLSGRCRGKPDLAKPLGGRGAVGTELGRAWWPESGCASSTAFRLLCLLRQGQPVMKGVPSLPSLAPACPRALLDLQKTFSFEIAQGLCFEF